MSGTNDLRSKQAAFVEEYLIDFNGTQAAIRAGYSVKTARKTASENLTKPDIIDALALRRSEIAEANDVTPEKVAAEYVLMGFADIGDYVEWNPDGITLTPSSELAEGATRAVSEITEVRTKDGVTIKFKLHDKKGALDSLCRQMGWNAPAKVDATVEGHVTHEHIEETLEERIARYAGIVEGVIRHIDNDGPVEPLDSLPPGPAFSEADQVSAG